MLNDSYAYRMQGKKEQVANRWILNEDDNDDDDDFHRHGTVEDEVDGREYLNPSNSRSNVRLPLVSISQVGSTSHNAE